MRLDVFWVWHSLQPMTPDSQSLTEVDAVTKSCCREGLAEVVNCMLEGISPLQNGLEIASCKNACPAGVELEDKLPEHEYRDLFRPDDRLHISVSYEHENLNTQEYLDSLQQKLFNNLSRCGNLCSKQ